MFLGALLDAGLPLDALREALGSLAIDHCRVDARKVMRAGVSATQLVIDETAAPLVERARGPHPLTLARASARTSEPRGDRDDDRSIGAVAGRACARRRALQASR